MTFQKQGGPRCGVYNSNPSCTCGPCCAAKAAYEKQRRDDKTAEGLCYKCGRVELEYRTCLRCRLLAAAGKKRRALALLNPEPPPIRSSISSTEDVPGCRESMR